MYNKIIIKKTATPSADLTAWGVAFFMSVFSACTDLTSPVSSCAPFCAAYQQF